MALWLLFWFTVAMALLIGPDAVPMLIVAVWLALVCHRLMPNFWRSGKGGAQDWRGR